MTPRVLLGASGSVAVVKVPALALLLARHGSAEVRVVLTQHAEKILRATRGYNVEIYEEYMEMVRQSRILQYADRDEWDNYENVGSDPVLHIELRKWADVLVIAPLSANTMAKMVAGICDNLLTCIVRAWDAKKRIVVAPAMNTFMWENPLTLSHVSELRSRGVLVVPPQSKLLACGDTGTGAMADIEPINEVVARLVLERPSEPSSANTGSDTTNLESLSTRSAQLPQDQHRLKSFLSEKSRAGGIEIVVDDSTYRILRAGVSLATCATLNFVLDNASSKIVALACGGIDGSNACWVFPRAYAAAFVEAEAIGRTTELISLDI